MKRHVLRHLKNNHSGMTKEMRETQMKNIDTVVQEERQRDSYGYNCPEEGCYISCKTRKNILRHGANQHGIDFSAKLIEKQQRQQCPPLLQQRAHIRDVMKYGKMTYYDMQRILKNCAKGADPLNSSTCCIWKAWCVSKSDKGNQHGMFSFRGKTVRVHCLLYHNFVGPLPSDFGRQSGKNVPAICHTCDSNGRCLNISHLYLGTISSNTRDKLIHGNGPRQKLTVENVKRIKSMGTTKTKREIAERFNITSSEVVKILKGKVWGWV